MPTPPDTFWIILMLCIWCHILDDFVLQMPILANLKQKDWWKKQIGTTFEYSPYNEDYVIALAIHGVSWSCSILFPIMGWFLLTGTTMDVHFLWLAFVFNALIHAIVDHMKANLFMINLVTDQIMHLIQIVLTVFIFTTRCVM